MKKEKETIKEEIEEIIKKEWRPNDGVPLSFIADQLYALFCQTLQHFIEETKIKEISFFGGRPVVGVVGRNGVAGYNQALKDINQNQAKWLKENL